MIDELKIIANNKLSNSKNKKEYNKYEIIAKILNDPDCFLKMDIKIAYSILNDLGFEEEKISKLYQELLLNKK